MNIVKRKLYEINRNKLLKNAISNVGKIVEEDDRIVCYVDQYVLEKMKNNDSLYKLHLHGFDHNSETIMDGVYKYHLDKPVFFVFDHITFTNALEVKAIWSSVEFRNCTFDEEINISYGKNIIFNNNKYFDRSNLYHFGNCFLNIENVNKVIFFNDNFINSYNNSNGQDKNDFGMKIAARTIIMSNTTVNTTGNIKFNAANTKLRSTDINAGRVQIDSGSIDFAQSIIRSNNANYNGFNLANETKNVDTETLAKKELRIKLINQLRNLRDNCLQVCNNETESVDELRMVMCHR